MEVGDLVQGRRMHDLHQAFRRHLVRCCGVLPLGVIALDGAGMPHTALLGFGFLAHASRLAEVAQSAIWHLTTRRNPYLVSNGLSQGSGLRYSLGWCMAS